jgi:neurotransmitter:Na+ symporter, NSS family
MVRDRWSSRMVFLLAAIGSAVGLGNIWRFPFLTYKYGGGAFLIPYLIALFIIGIPTLILEFALGQKLQCGAVKAFKQINTKLSGIGITAVYAGFIVVAYYAVVMAWALMYFFKSFNFTLPWANDASSYFFNNILNVSGSAGILGGINWPLFFSLALIWIAVYFTVWKGVKSVGKVIVVLMPLPMLLLLILFIRGLTLDGASLGILYYLKPNFMALLDTEIWLMAATQIFFTLSLAFGIMIAYGSYKDKKSDISKNAYITAFTNSSVSLIAGFVVFSILGYMATSTNVSVSEVVASGPGLAFIAFPQALSLMPFAWFFSAIFFAMLLMLGLDSAFSMIEAVDTTIADSHRKWSRAKIAAFVCGIAFLLGVIFTTGAGLYYLDIFDHFVTSFILVIVGILQTIAVGWIYGADKLRKYINSVSDWKVGKWWEYSIKFIIPIVLFMLLILQIYKDLTVPYEDYPIWALSLGWMIVIIGVLFVVWKVFFNGKISEVKTNKIVAKKKVIAKKKVVTKKSKSQIKAQIKVKERSKIRQSKNRRKLSLSKTKVKQKRR